MTLPTAAPRPTFLPTDFERLVRPFWIQNRIHALDAHENVQQRSALAPFLTGSGRKDVLAAARALQIDGTFVELGTFKAEFAEQLFSECQPKQLYLVDPYSSYEAYRDISNSPESLDEIYNEACRRMARFGTQVTFVRAFSEQASVQFADGSIDFLYIDGNHSFRFVYEDLRHWYPKVRTGGLICGDDAADVDDARRDAAGDVEIVWERHPDGSPKSAGYYGVLKAVREFCSERSIQFFLSGLQFLIVKHSDEQ